jgi:hypothetical protein
VLDWQQLVRNRIGALGLHPEREEEVIAELAGHFEDVYEDNLSCDASTEQAFACAFSEVSDWAGLSREIRHAAREEEPMNERTKNLWLPGMVTLFLSSVVLMLITRFGPLPQFVWVDPRVPLLLYVPWLVSLPLFGALGAYWSRRAGGRLRSRILAGVFPVLALAAPFFLILPVALVFEGRGWRLLQLKAFVIFLLGWVVIPGAALLAGVLPFMKNESHTPVE